MNRFILAIPLSAVSMMIACSDSNGTDDNRVETLAAGDKCTVSASTDFSLTETSPLGVSAEELLGWMNAGATGNALFANADSEPYTLQSVFKTAQYVEYTAETNPESPSTPGSQLICPATFEVDIDLSVVVGDGILNEQYANTLATTDGMVARMMQTIENPQGSFALDDYINSSVFDSVVTELTVSIGDGQWQGAIVTLGDNDNVGGGLVSQQTLTVATLEPDPG